MSRKQESKFQVKKPKDILVRVPLGRVKQLDKLVSEGFVANRNEAIREAIRDYCEVMKIVR